jgi:hypothetical protein
MLCLQNNSFQISVILDARVRIQGIADMYRQALKDTQAVLDKLSGEVDASEKETDSASKIKRIKVSYHSLLATYAAIFDNFKIFPGCCQEFGRTERKSGPAESPSDALDARGQQQRS